MKRRMSTTAEISLSTGFLLALCVTGKALGVSLSQLFASLPPFQKHRGAPRSTFSCSRNPRFDCALIVGYVFQQSGSCIAGGARRIGDQVALTAAYCCLTKLDAEEEWGGFLTKLQPTALSNLEEIVRNLDGD